MTAKARARKRIVVTANDLTGRHASGRGLRALGVAGALAPYHDVCLLCQSPPELAVPPGVSAVSGPAERRRELGAADVVVTANELTGRELATLGRAVLVADLYDPHLFQLPWSELSGTSRARLIDQERRAWRFAFGYADLVLCGNEPQRDLYLGARLASRRRLGLPFADDAAVPGGVVVLPNGVSACRPAAEAVPQLRRDLGLSPGDLLCTWGGGVWGFLDPEVAVAAIMRARAAEPRLYLFFLWLSRDEPVAEPAKRLLALCGRAGTGVLMNDRWVPAEARWPYLAASTAGVLAQHSGLETHFSFRTRLVDCIWAGLPVVSAGADTLTRTAAEQGWALVSPEGNVAALAASLLKLADEGTVQKMREALEKVRPSWTWEAQVVPLLAALDEVPAPGAVLQAQRAGAAAAMAAWRRAARVCPGSPSKKTWS